MKLSYQWLAEQLKTKKMPTPQDIAKQLSLKTVEVEDILDQGAFLQGVVVGEILEIKKHPDADKLSIAQVDVGEKKPRQIIFGQMVQMQAGFKVPVALAPTMLPGNKEIKKANLRGVVSEGMLCLDQELGLLKEGVSIQFFDRKIKNGTRVTDALGLNDTILEIDNKSLSNRPDLFGHYGIAREISAIFNIPLKPYNPSQLASIKGTKLSVTVKEEKLCPRYTAAVIEEIKIGPSPQWLQNRLRAVGLRPINNIVDITNYVMYELGQPMHAFDAKKITMNKEQMTISVRKAKPGEKVRALDEKEYTLAKDMLVIADFKKPVAIAGIIGGAESAVCDTTTSIVFESANFDPVSIRKTSSLLGIRTDSSTRFEKSLDPTLTEVALRRAVELVRQLCPGARVVSQVVDKRHFRLQQGPIMLSEDFVCERVGVKIPEKKIITYLTALGFLVKRRGKHLAITVPTWRATKDVSIAEDLIEEIVRLYGYEHVPSSFPVFSIAPPSQPPLLRLERDVKEFLAYEFGYTEVYNYSFESKEWLAKIGENITNLLELDNPVAKDRPLIRRSVLPNMLINMEENLHRHTRVSIFEIGSTFHQEEMGEKAEPKKQERLPKQDTILGLMFAQQGTDIPYFEVAGALEGLFFRLGVPVDFLRCISNSLFHPGRCAEMRTWDKKIGTVGELRPSIQERIGIPYRVAMAEISLDALIHHIKEKSHYRPLSLFPTVERDVAFLVSKEAEHAAIEKFLRNADALIADVTLFDVYQGENVPSGKKSMAYRLVYRSDERTLTTQEVDAVHAKVIAMLEKKFGAEIRR